MAGRPNKQGIDYFPLDVGFFSELKIRKIAKGCGPNSTSVLICLLCNIYRRDGYYILWDEDLPFFIADEVGVSEGCVKEILLKAIQVGFFDVEKYSAYGILTSYGIQKRFFEITKRREAIDIIEDYLINVDNNSIIVCKNSINVYNNEQSKVKERKENSLSGVKEKFPSPEVFDKPLNDCHSELLHNTSWCEAVTMNTRSSGFKDFTMDSFRQYLSAFFAKLQNEGETCKSPKDAMSHFARWLKIELEKQSKNGNNRNCYTSKQEANDYAMQQYLSDRERLEQGIHDEVPKPF